MPLLQCPDCGNQVSDRAASCPKCGCPTKNSGPLPIADPAPYVVPPGFAVCEKCFMVGHPQNMLAGSDGVEVGLWLLFLAPGIIYSIWRRANRYDGCTKCRGKMLAGDTPRARLLAQEFFR